MDRTHNQDNNASWNEDTEWVSSSWPRLTDRLGGMRLPPERARTDPFFINENSVDRTGRRASSLTFQRMTFPLVDEYISSRNLANTPQETRLHSSNRRLLSPFIHLRNRCHTWTIRRRCTAARQRLLTLHAMLFRDR
jgi:hypothetical protein